MCLVGICRDSPITSLIYSSVKCWWSCRYCIPICSFNVPSNYNFLIEIGMHSLFQLCDEKFLIYDIMIYIQGLDQFDMGVKPTTSAKP